MINSELAKQQLLNIQQRIIHAAAQAGRDPVSVKLLGASKVQSAQTVRAFQQAGLESVGENYLQEAIDKQKALADIDLHWHFIGGIQSNKCKEIAHNFSWVHGVDRLKIAQRLNQYNDIDSNACANKPINVLLQINVDDENSKNGVSLNLAPELAEQVSQLENIRLRGLMLIPKARKTIDEQRKPFAQAYELLQQINQRYGLNMDSLSMGMSGDLEAAILEGSTMVRIGTALFGERVPNNTNQ